MDFLASCSLRVLEKQKPITPSTGAIGFFVELEYAAR
jgi:hypothetical protein